MKGIPPVITDLNDLLRLFLSLGRVSLLFRILHNGLSVLRVNGVQDIEEVRAVNAATFGKVVWEEGHELGVR